MKNNKKNDIKFAMINKNASINLMNKYLFEKYEKYNCTNLFEWNRNKKLKILINEN